MAVGSEDSQRPPSPDGMGPDGDNEKQTMTWRERFEDSKGMLLVLCSESFGTGMAAATKLLVNGSNMSVLQIMFVRFGITLVLSTWYMWYTAVPDFPFGKREVRWLLAMRGAGGMVGVYGFYYSLQYLPVAEALLISFISPLTTSYACSFFLHAPFVKKQLYAGLVSFIGIILIARPAPLFGSAHSDHPTTAPSSRDVASTPDVTPSQRLFAIALGLLSVCGATAAYTSIRVIGPRAHPLLSVNYYALMSTLISFLFLSLPITDETFRLPHGSREWGLLLGLGVFGFGLQFLMTAGLVKDKTSRATNMMYSSIVFGLLLDWAVWGVVPTWLSWLGGAIVVTATVWGAMQKAEEGPKGPRRDEEYAMVAGEDAFLVEDGSDDDDDDEGTVHGEEDLKNSAKAHDEAI